MNIKIEHRNGKEIRWVNGVPYTRPSAKHTDYWERCPECDGTGEREVMDTETKNRVRDFTVTPSSIIIPCENCKGEGRIEL